MDNGVREKIAQAIRAMRDVCDDADRLMKPGRYRDDELLSLAIRVHHVFVWGWANASSDIETAIARVERAYLMKAATERGDGNA